jgi:hypothetical protein
MTTRPGYVWSSATNEWIQIGPIANTGSIVFYQTSEPASAGTGDIWIDADDDVAGITSSLNYRWRKIATGGETSLSGNDSSGLPLAYNPGYEQVYLNGVLQYRGGDYTATTGNTITGLTALVANDTIEVLSFVTSPIGDTYTQAAADAKFNTGYRFNQRLSYGTAGTYTFNKADYPWLRAIKVCLQGAGGGGGGARATTGSQQSYGDGGGGGAYGEVFITDIGAMTSSSTITVGAAGAAGTTTANAGAGGNSSFASNITYVAGGGAGGNTNAVVSSAGVIQFGGGGGTTATNLTYVVPGEHGQGGICVSPTALTFQGGSRGGAGGKSFLGVGGVPGNAAAGGVSAGSQGGGGGGRNAGADNPAAGGSGALGGAGVVILELYS